MKKIFVCAAYAALCCVAFFTACQKEVVNDQTSEEKVTLRISVPLPDTKVVSGSDETAIWNYQAFLFKEDGVIEDYVSQSTSDLSLDCTLGLKTIVVLVNAPSMGDVMDRETLLARTSLLSDNEEDAFVMEGKMEINIQNRDLPAVRIPVTRKVARVQLSSLKVAIDMPQYSSKPFKVSSVYLINVPSEAYYFDSVTALSWYNKLGYVEEDDNTLIYDDMEDFEITPETPYTAKNVFYCYPNSTSDDLFTTTWEPRRTRLVVEATLGDERYYYPVTLPSLDQNKCYEVNLVITRPGALTPDSEIDKFAVGVRVDVNDWVTGSTVTEEI